MFASKAILLANPNFAKLYKKLTTQYLTSTGATKEVAKKLNDESLLREKSEYLEALIIYNGIKQIALGKIPLINAKIESDDYEMIIRTLEKALSFAESRQYLNFQPKDPELKKVINKDKNNIRSGGCGGREEDFVTIFGLKDDDLYKLVKDDLMELENSKIHIINIIENGLIKQYKDIVKFYYAGDEINSKSIIPNAKRLEKLLSQQIDDLKSSKINLTRNKILLNENLMEYFKILKNNLSNLWILNEEFKCHNEMEKNSIFINYFSGLIESIELKTRVHLYETLRVVYDDDTVKMLRTIRNNLLNEEQNKIQELTNLNNELLKYQNIKDFDDIIDKYIEMNKEIKKIDDDIKRLKQ